MLQTVPFTTKGLHARKADELFVWINNCSLFKAKYSKEDLNVN